MIGWLRQRFGGLPAQARGQVALDPGERLLAWAVSPDGTVVASSWRLWLPGTQGYTQLDWDRVDKAGWQPPVLSLTPADGAPVRRVRLDPAREVPAAVRAAVTQAVAFSRRESLDPLPGALRIVGRRSPRTRDLRWEVAFDPGTPADDPGVRARAEQLLVAAREELARGVLS